MQTAGSFIGIALWTIVGVSQSLAAAGDCQRFAYGSLKIEPQKGKDDPNWKAAENCATELASLLRQLEPELRGEAADEAMARRLNLRPFGVSQPLSSKDSVRRSLIRLHRVYRNIKQTLGQPGRDLVSMHEADDAVHDLMARYELRERIGTAIDAGVTWAETGNDQVRPARDAKFETKGKGLLRWESEHFSDDSPVGGHMDFSVGGSFGFTPVMTLVSVLDPGSRAPIGGVEKPTPFATYFQGFTWDIAGRAHLTRAARSEPAFFARYGHTLLLADSDSFERSGAASQNKTVVMERLRNTTGRVARFWETGLEARMYEQESMDQIHHEKSYITPALHAAIGYRNDSRFQPGEQLTDTTPHRVFFRLAISFNRMVKGKAEGEKPSKASFQFGVDYERPASGRAPGGIRFFFGPDLSLLGFTNGK